MDQLLRRAANGLKAACCKVLNFGKQLVIDFIDRLILLSYEHMQNLRNCRNYVTVFLIAFNMMTMLAMPHLELLTGEEVSKNMFAVRRYMKVFAACSLSWKRVQLAGLLSFVFIFHSSSKLLNILLSLPWSYIFVRTFITIFNEWYLFLFNEKNRNGQFLFSTVVIYALLLVSQLYIAYETVFEKLFFDFIGLLRSGIAEPRFDKEYRLPLGAFQEDFSCSHISNAQLDTRRRTNLLNNALMENELQALEGNHTTESIFDGGFHL